MKPSLIIANPTSGQGKGLRILAEALDYLDAQRLQYRVIASNSLEKSLEELRKSDYSDFERLLIIGGDGMMHYTINALFSDSKKIDIAVGLIPAGTGNDFARALRLNLKRPVKNIDQYMSSTPDRFDLGLVNNRLFGAICSTGFDSIVNERANKMSWPKGRRKYDIAMLQELPRFKAREYEIEIDGRKFDTEAMLIAVANGPSYGGGMKVCPQANLRDGLLDVMILHPVPKGEFLRIFPSVYSGSHINHPEVEIIRGRTIAIAGDAVTYADGERISPAPVTITTHEGALRTWSANV